MSAIAVSPRIMTGAGVRGGVPGAARSGAPRRAERRPVVDRSLEARRASRDGAAVSPEGGAGCVAGAQAPLRLTRRGRLVVVLLAVLVVAGGLLGGRAVAEGPVRAAEVQTYAVQSGDTLWAIAATVAEPGEDVRDVVLALQELNGLGDGAIAAGQVLVLPAAD